MTETTRYAAALEAELNELTVELREIATQDPQDTHNWVPRTDDIAADEPDEIDVADKTEAWVSRTGEVAVLERRYNDIQRALGKITDGTYGTCEICGEPVEDARLDANPAARTCIAHRDDEEALPR